MGRSLMLSRLLEITRQAGGDYNTDILNTQNKSYKNGDDINYNFQFFNILKLLNKVKKYNYK
jgi:hypothetical protein